MTLNNSIKIAIAEDCELIRHALKKICSDCIDFQLLFDVSNGIALIEELQNCICLPDVLIMDVSMQMLSGYKAITHIKQKWPHIRVIILSKYCGKYSVQYMLKMALAHIFQKTLLLIK